MVSAAETHVENAQSGAQVGLLALSYSNGLHGFEYFNCIRAALETKEIMLCKIMIYVRSWKTRAHRWLRCCPSCAFNKGMSPACCVSMMFNQIWNSCIASMLWLKMTPMTVLCC